MGQIKTAALCSPGSEEVRRRLGLWSLDGSGVPIQTLGQCCVTRRHWGVKHHLRGARAVFHDCNKFVTWFRARPWHACLWRGLCALGLLQRELLGLKSLPSPHISDGPIVVRLSRYGLSHKPGILRRCATYSCASVCLPRKSTAQGRNPSWG